MDLLKVAVIGGIGWYVYTHYLVKKSVGSGVSATPKTIAVGEPGQTDLIQAMRDAVTDPMYLPSRVAQDRTAPWYDPAHNLIM